MKTNIAVLVSGGGTNLQALIDAQQRGELGGGEITAVISPRKALTPWNARRTPASPAMSCPARHMRTISP